MFLQKIKSFEQGKDAELMDNNEQLRLKDQEINNLNW